jgi:hypothetical protein
MCKYPRNVSKFICNFSIFHMKIFGLEILGDVEDERWVTWEAWGGVFGVHCRCCGVGIVVEMWVLGGGLEYSGLDGQVEFREGG